MARTKGLRGNAERRDGISSRDQIREDFEVLIFLESTLELIGILTLQRE